MGQWPCTRPVKFPYLACSARKGDSDEPSHQALRRHLRPARCAIPRRRVSPRSGGDWCPRPPVRSSRSAAARLTLLTHRPSVTSLTITEPDASMLESAPSVRQDAFDDRPAGPSPRTSPSEDETFDVVVSTLVLCGVDDRPGPPGNPPRLAPGGEFLFLEHVRPLTPAQRRNRTG